MNAYAQHGTAVIVRPAVDTDAEDACEVLRRSIRELCVADHEGDERILTAWLADKTPDNVRAWITSPEYFSVVAVRESEVCGVGLITRRGEIQLCYVAPEVQFRGAGKRILLALEEQAQRWGSKNVVLTSSLTGRLFYERNGYVSRGAPVSAFGGMTAFPMSKTLP